MGHLPSTNQFRPNGYQSGRLSSTRLSSIQTTADATSLAARHTLRKTLTLYTRAHRYPQLATAFLTDKVEAL